jgi:hypothetical protein
MPKCTGKDRLDAFKGCGKEVPNFRGGSNVYKLCYKCNQKRLAQNKPKKKPTGEYALFEAIWATRPHESFISGEPLDKYYGTDFWVNLFAHVLPKKNYPKFRLYDKNIVLLTPYEHQILDQGTEDQRRKYARECRCSWINLFDLKRKLIKEYES